MIPKTCLRLVALLPVLGLSALAARAAPDNTLGMAIMSATVSSAGTLTRGSGVNSVEKTGTGSYTVAFNRRLENCTCVVNLGGEDGNTDYIVSWKANANCPGFQKPVNVATIYTSRDLQNQYLMSDASFHLLVFCAK
jgi:hypothetical protein